MYIWKTASIFTQHGGKDQKEGKYLKSTKMYVAHIMKFHETFHEIYHELFGHPFLSEVKL
jgi:hypothetical protein